MEIKEFISNFAEQLDDVDVEVMSPETEFRSLDGWSSLSALSVIAMMDEEYGFLLDSNTFRKASTIQDLYNLINK